MSTSKTTIVAIPARHANRTFETIKDDKYLVRHGRRRHKVFCRITETVEMGIS